MPNISFNKSLMFSNIPIALLLLTPICLFIFIYSLAFAVKPIPAIVLFIVMFSFFIFYFWLQMGLYIALFLNPFDRLTSLGPGSAITITKIVIIAVLFAMLVRMVSEKDIRLIRRLYDNPLTISAYFLLLFSVISIVNAHNHEIFWYQLIKRLSAFGLYIIIITIVDSRRTLYRILKILLCAYFFVGLTGVYELFAGKSFLGVVFAKKAMYQMYDIAGEGIRIEGPYGDPDLFSSALILPISLCAVFFYLSRSMKVKLLISGLFCFFIINLLGTSSRSGVIATLISLFTIWYFLKFRRKYLIGALVMILFLISTLLSLLVFPITLASLKRYTGERGRRAIYERLGYHEMAFSAIRKHPILGIGTGNFVVDYNRYINEKVQRTPAEPHNAIVQSWVENGFFGMFSYLLLYIFAIRNAYRTIKFEEDIYFRGISVAILATISGLFFFAGTANVLQSQEYWIIFAFSVILINCHKTRT